MASNLHHGGQHLMESAAGRPFTGRHLISHRSPEGMYYVSHFSHNGACVCLTTRCSVSVPKCVTPMGATACKASAVLSASW